uniref:Uncharacterized protein n=1 Tax=Bubo bubo TaxID=30461 RepID=A0A8C0EZR1_BUBBB
SSPAGWLLPVQCNSALPPPLSDGQLSFLSPAKSKIIFSIIYHGSADVQIYILKTGKNLKFHYFFFL